MPTRIVREGILTSESVNQLSERAELFYRRLMSVADDYGRYFSHPSLLRAACYPLRLRQVSEADVKQMLNECISLALIIPFGGKYIQIIKFGQQTRSKSKFPEPTEDELLIKCKSNVKQMCSLVGVGVGVEGVSGDGKNTPAEIPTWKEVKDYANGHAVSEKTARHFFDHHQGNSLWINNYGRMIDWRHKLVSWSVNDREKSQIAPFSTIQSGKIPPHQGGNF